MMSPGTGISEPFRFQSPGDQTKARDQTKAAKPVAHQGSMGPPKSIASLSTVAKGRPSAVSDKPDTLVSEILQGYFSGEPIHGSKMFKLREQISKLQDNHLEEWYGARQMLSLYERTQSSFIALGESPTTIVQSFGRLLNLLWRFCPTLTKAMQQKDDCLKDIVSFGLVNVQQEVKQRLTLSEIVKQIVTAMPRRIDGLIDCMNVAVDVAETTTTTQTNQTSWEKLMFRTFQSSGSLPPSIGDDAKVILRGLQKLDSFSWPQTETELIETVEFVMSITQNRISPVKILQEMMLTSQTPQTRHVTPSLLVCSPSQILSRLQATLLILKFIEPLAFDRWSRAGDRISPQKRVSGSDFARVDPRKKHISPRKLKTLEIETKLAEIACRRAVADRGVPRAAPKSEVSDAKLPFEVSLSSVVKPSAEVPVSSDPMLSAVLVSETQKDHPKGLSHTIDLTHTTTHSTTITPSSPLDAAEIARRERDAEILELLDNVSSNKPPEALEDPKQAPSRTEKLLQIKQEISGLAQVKTRLSASEAKSKIAHLQPGVEKFLGSIQGHDPHVANAFLIALIMSGQADTQTTLEQAQRQKLRYPRHKSVFLPKDDKLLLQLMRGGAQAGSSKLNRLFKRHLASDIDLRTKFLAYLIARRESV